MLSQFAERLPIRLQIALPMLTVIILGLLVLIGVTSTIQFNEARHSASQQMRGLATSEVASVIRYFEEASHMARQGSVMTSTLLKEKAFDRQIFSRILLNTLEDHKELTGFYGGFEPNFDGQDAAARGTPLGDENGRYLMYATRDDSGHTQVEISPMTGDAAEDEWYNTPMKSRKDTFTAPYADIIGGETVLMTSAVSPVVVDGKSVGVITVDLGLNRLHTMLGKIKPLDSGYLMLISANGQWIATPDKSKLGTPVADKDILDIFARTQKGETVETILPDSKGDNYVLQMIPVKFSENSGIWGFAVVVPEDTILANARQTRWLLIGTGGVILLIAAALTMFLGRRISVPVLQMTAAMKRLAEGDLTTEIRGSKRGDEMGAMARAVEVFKSHALAVRAMEEQTRQQEQKASEDRKRLLVSMAETFRRHVGELVGSVANSAHAMQSQAGQMAESATSVSQDSSTASYAAGQASTNVQTVTAASTEMARSIAIIREQVSVSADIANQAVEQVNRNQVTMERLSSAASKIGEAITLINAIASQTNLLALNATIEAARAGEAGKGFAVVANEVKQLASQTASATGEISAQVEAVQQSSSEAIQAIGSIGETISEISEICQEIAQAVEQQKSATEEISRSICQVADGTSEVSSAISSVKDRAADSHHGAETVLEASQRLAQDARALSEQVDSFLANLQAA
ncbi:methyl-accepting chemotaxis protein [Insolitispirillum peregrinum]|uniref:methyl-accepting chemotaxis protein n=1 Tax=Insolitispirillum peregrinum TaxID=80876 RepID=UPI0036184C47